MALHKMAQQLIQNTTNATEQYLEEGGKDSKGTQDWGSLADSYFVLGLYGVICVVGIAGNLLVAIVLLRVPSLRSNTSDFLIHLSLVDFLVCVLVIPFKLVSTTGTPAPNPGFLGELRCRVYVSQFIFWVCALISILGLVTVNLERFVAIVHPHKYKAVFTRRNKYLMIASCWVFAALSKSFILSVYGEDERVGCHFLGWPSRAVQAGVGFFSFSVTLLLPFVLMVSVQWRVISTLRGQVRALSSRLASTAHDKTDQQKMWQLRVTKTLVTTLLSFVITFAICWGPSQVTFLLSNLGVPVDFASPFYHTTVILSVCNSCVNPIIYAVTNQPFRRGVRDMLLLRRNDVEHSTQGEAVTAVSRPVTIKTDEI